MTISKQQTWPKVNPSWHKPLVISQGKSLADLVADFQDTVSIGNAYRRLSDSDKYYVGCSLLHRFKLQADVYKDSSNTYDVLMYYLAPQLYLLSLVRLVVNPTNNLRLSVWPTVASGLAPFFEA